jgi:hypothetical protein
MPGRAGQNRLVFDAPTLFDAPVLEITDADNMVVPRKDDQVIVANRTWLVEQVTHSFSHEPSFNTNAPVRQYIRIVLREL